MTKGNPNDESRKLNFVPKVYDPVAKDYKPLYIAPEATDSVLGDVYLSDAIDSTADAKTQITAATPKAVNTVYKEAQKKLDTTISSDQTVKSKVTFQNAITANEGVTVPDGKYFHGDLDGNAETASALSPGATIAVKSGSKPAGSPQKFTGNSNITLTIGKIDATTVEGVLPLSTIPQGALERVVSYASIDAAVSAWTGASSTKPFDIGDTIRVTGTTPNVMYSVIADPSSKSNYIEYAAGTATDALHSDEADVAVKLKTPRTIQTNLGSASSASFDGSANITPGITGTLPIGHGGTGATTKTAAVQALLSNLSKLGTGVTDSTGFAHYNTSSGIPDYFTGAEVWAYIKTKTDAAYATKAHTHSVFSKTAAGFVPISDGSTTKFLRADGTWQVAGAVTGVKGNSEQTYRTGNVNITAANIGAATANHTHSYLPLAGGTLTGTINCRAITPTTTNTYNLGTSSLKFANVYSTNFIGNVTGNVTGSLSGNAATATTASRLNKTLTLSGNVTGSVSLNSDGTSTMTTTIANKAVTNGKLADDVGTVYVGATEPTEAHVKLWIKI